MRRLLTVSIAVVGMMVLLAGSAGAADERKPDATVKISEGAVALGVGWTWGKGELTYKGKTYKFKVDGLSVVEVGVTKAESAGKVYNLKQLADFDGVYAAAGAAATAGKGAGASALTNGKKVEIVLESKTSGANLKLAAEGIKIKLEK